MNQDPVRREASRPARSRAMRLFHQRHPGFAAEGAAFLRKLWQDPDYRARMSIALRGIEKRPLTPEQKRRVAAIVSESLAGSSTRAAAIMVS